MFLNIKSFLLVQNKSCSYNTPVEKQGVSPLKRDDPPLREVILPGGLNPMVDVG